MDLAKTLSFEDADAQNLSAVLGCAADGVKDALVAHAQAALDEYIDMYLGRRAPTVGREILQNRLSLLMQRAMQDDMPTDDQVARLFNINQSQARTLIRNTISKHRFQLAGVVGASAKKVLEKAAKTGDDYTLTVRSIYLVEWMNQELDRRNQGSPPLTVIRDRVSRYLAAASSYEILCTAFGAAPVG